MKKVMQQVPTTPPWKRYKAREKVRNINRTTCAVSLRAAQLLEDFREKALYIHCTIFRINRRRRSDGGQSSPCNCGTHCAL